LAFPKPQDELKSVLRKNERVLQTSSLNLNEAFS
jgi:hypothetical protein